MSYKGTGCSAFSTAEPDVKETFEQMAVDLLWNWTNRIFGTFSEVIRPSRVVTPWRPTTFEGAGPDAAYYELGGRTGGWGWLPVYTGSNWLTLRCGICGTVACGCDPQQLFSIHLPGPIESVENITINGEVLDPEDYRIDYGHTLIRQDGKTWPTRQNLLKKLGEEDTWSIEFTRGVPVPVGGQIAAGMLACELHKASTMDPTCGLPSRVQSVTRQGVSMEVVATEFKDIQDGRTGLSSVDFWIASVTRPREYAGITFPGAKAPNRWNAGPR